MIESIYVNEKDSDFCYAGTRVGMPRNVRQIGKSNGSFGIYIEDYAKSYLKQMAEADYTECCVAILIGKYMKNEYGCNLFIQGAMHIREACVDGHVDFSQKVWEKVYSRMKMFFPGSEAVGWFLGGPGFLMQDEEVLLKIHLNNFADREKIMFVYDVLEKEEVIFVSDGVRLIMQEGYFVYYEKNDEMQAYMLEYRQEDVNERISPGKEKWGNSVDEKTDNEISAFRKRNRFELVAAFALVFVLIATMGSMFIDKVDIQEVMSFLISEDESGKKEDASVGGDVQHSLFLEQLETLKHDEEIKIGERTIAEDNESVEVVVVTENEKNTDVNEMETINEETDIGKAEYTDNNISDSVETDTESFAEAENDKIDDNKSEETQPVSGNLILTKHTVVKGETLVGICRRYYGNCGNLQVILELNQIDNENLIYEGQILYLP